MESDIILWTTHCPKCKVLEMKLKQKGIIYKEMDDIEEMMSRGWKQAPILEANGCVYDFAKAIEFIKTLEAGD